MIGIIVALDREGLMAYDEQIPWKKPADLKRFKKLTTGGVVIMGRKTFNSMGRCLPGRMNIVITSDPKNLEQSNPVPYCYSSMTSALALAQSTGKPIWIIGGKQIYELAYEFADFIDMTRIDAEYPVADVSKAIYLDAPDPLKFRYDSEESNSEDPNLRHLRYTRITA